jgi:hypothetical protein
MLNRKRFLTMAAMAAFAIAGFPGGMHAQSSGTVLKAAELQALIPASVFYRGQSATTQLRNSGGVKFSDGYFVLSVLVDTGGYSTSVAEKYQAYFINEVPITIGGQKLPAGVYGVGFVADNKFIVTDVGGHDVFMVADSTDNDLKRPMPLQVTSDAGGGFRLYKGRQYVSFSR